MTDEDAIHDEEVDESLEDELEQDEDEVGIADSDDLVAAPASTKKVKEEAIEDFSIASRQKLRDELDAQVAAFLAKGGTISEVPANVTADPPKKPSPDYGGRPI